MKGRTILSELHKTLNYGRTVIDAGKLIFYLPIKGTLCDDRGTFSDTVTMRTE